MKIKTGQGNMTLQKLIAIYSISMVTSLPGLAISPILGKLESIFSSTSELQLQMLESLPSFIIVPFILLAGRMSLYFNTKKLLITGLAIFSACSIAYPFADRMWALLLISGLLGIGAGLVIPFSTGLVADYFSGSYRTKQLGYVSAITNLTLVIATLLAGFLAGISWHLSFVVYCISGISLFFAFYLDEKPPFYSASAQELRHFRHVDIRILFVYDFTGFADQPHHRSTESLYQFYSHRFTDRRINLLCLQSRYVLTDPRSHSDRLWLWNHATDHLR